MFERYTEKARRVIFFARYEACQYGSRYIDTEHILLGLLREDPTLMNRALRGRGGANEIRTEIERGIERRERISTAREVPLSQDAKRILTFASEEAGQLNDHYVSAEHIVLGILMTPDSVAGRILTERGATLADFRGQVSSGAGFERGAWRLRQIEDATVAINSFLAGIGRSKWTDFSPILAENTQFVDSEGRRWQGREEIGRQFEALLLPYAKKGVTFILESIDNCVANIFIASILWENVTVAGGSSKSVQRMTVLLEEKEQDWLVCFIQVTPVRVSGALRT
jgi:ATP-dependent Clp protease ATP-binding subunit ClpA